MKKSLFAALACLLCLSSAQALDFSGYAGILGDYNGSVGNTGYDNNLTLQGFLAAQIDFNGKFIFRGEFKIETADLFDSENNPLKPRAKNTIFQVGELSVTWHFSSAAVSHFLSGFIGKFEPIGSDVFLQRHLGLQPISSRLMENWGGLVGTSIFNDYGLGLSYTAHLHKSLVWGAYLYAFDSASEMFSINSLNTELRIAGNFPGVIFDASANLAFTFTTGAKLYEADPVKYEYVKNNLLIVQSVLFKIGANLLLGDRYGVSTLIQLGLSNVSLGADSGSTPVFGLNTMGKFLYAFIEPRFNFGETQVAIAVFNLPNDNLRGLLYLKGFNLSSSGSIEGLLGLNLCIANTTLRIGSTNITLGGHLTACYEKNITGLISDISTNPADIIGNIGLYVTPFASIPLLGGEFKTAISFNPLAFIPSSTAYTAFDAFVGFKVAM